MQKTRIAALAALGVLAACGGGDPIAPPIDRGAIALSLTSPNADDGAVMLRIAGGTVDSVSAAPGGEVLRMEDTAPGVAEFVITGNPLGKVIGYAWFATPVPAREVVVTVMEVASNTTYEVRDVGAYRVAAIVDGGESGPTR